MRSHPSFLSSGLTLSAISLLCVIVLAEPTTTYESGVWEPTSANAGHGG